MTKCGVFLRYGLNCFMLEEFLQCYCRKIWQMLIFFINLCCSKARYRPDRSICIVEYHRKIILTNHLHTENLKSNLGHFSWVVALVPVISSSKQTLSWSRSSVIFSFRVARNALTGNRTQDNFTQFLFFVVLSRVSRNKQSKFDANRFIRSRGRIVHTYPQLNFISPYKIV
jgi:hypothetical protein